MRSFLSLAWLLTLCGGLVAVDYPHFRGADGRGAAPDSGLQLVDDFGLARLAWCSELRNPLPIEHRVLWANQIYPPWPMNCENNGSFASPVLADGKLYISWWRPTGTARAPKARGGPTAITGLIDGDDCLSCIDLASGRTLWTTVFAGTGANLVACAARDSQITPCVADGKVFWLGSIGVCYAVDATTGAKLWQVRTGKAEVWAWYKEELMAGRLLPQRGDPPWKKYRDRPTEIDPPNHEHAGSGGRNFNATPVVSGGVAVFGVCHDVVGIDIASGAIRWQHKGALSSSTSPVVWRETATGTERIICYGRGHLSCVDPQSGELLWRHADFGGAYQGHTPAISGDMLVCTARVPGAESRRASMVAGIRLGVGGPELAWSLPEGTSLGYRSPTIHRGRAYVMCQAQTRLFPPECGVKVQDSRTKVLYALDLASGAVLGVGQAPGGCASLFAMDGRLHYAQAVPQYYWDAEPDARGQLRVLSRRHFHNADSTTSTGAGGFLFRRGVGNMLYCWDLRQSPTAPVVAPSAEADPAQAAYQLDLAGALSDRRDLRVHLIARDGRFEQAWATLDDHVMPELCWSEDLHVEAGRLRGVLRCWLSSTIVDYHGKWRSGGRHYRFAIDAELVDGGLRGHYREMPIERRHFAYIQGSYRGIQVADEHHMAPTAGELAGAYAADVQELGLARFDRPQRVALKELRDLPSDAIDEFIRSAHDSPWPLVRREAAQRLTRAISPVRRFAQLMEAMQRIVHEDPSLAVRLATIRRLTHNGFLYPLLVSLLADPEPQIRQAALVSIARIREKSRSEADAALFEAVLAQADHGDLRVRVSAINTLGWLGEPALPALLALMTADRPDDDIEECLRALDQIAAGLQILPSARRDAVRRAILTALARPGIAPAYRSNAMRCLMKTGASALDNLVDLCGAAYPAELRLEALAQLVERGDTAVAAMPTVLAIANGEADERIRRQAIIALGALCDHDLADAPLPRLDAGTIRFTFAMLRHGQGYVPDSVRFRSALLIILQWPEQAALIESLASEADARQAFWLVKLARRLPVGDAAAVRLVEELAARFPDEDLQEAAAQSLAVLQATAPAEAQK